MLEVVSRCLPDVHLESGKIENNPEKLILWIMVELASRVHPKGVSLQMCPLALHIGPYGDVLSTSGRFSGTSSGRPRDVILQSG